MEDVDRETATGIARTYADEECVGELGEIATVEREGGNWIVEFRTHTFADAYAHRVRITATVGNVVSHERLDHLEED